MLFLAAAALGLLSYWQTISFGLFSEDLVHHYLALESFRSPLLILQSFTEPWTQCSRLGLFYRPLVDISFLVDCLLGERAWLYHLASLVYHIGCACLLGLTAKTMDSQAGLKKPLMTGILAASLFAASPLSAETLSWLSCRCDGLSCLFCLLSLRLYLKWQDGRLPLASLISFSLALLCKENAIMLPAVIIIHSYLSGGKAKALSTAKGYLTLTFIYVLLRLQILGGIGGYSGAIGETLNSSLVDRILYPAHWLRIFYPLGDAINYLAVLYSSLYGTLALLVVKESLNARSKAKLLPCYLLFTLAATALLLVPTAGAFVVNDDLFGSRFLYLPQAFYFLFLSFLIISLGRPGLVWAALYLGLCAVTANLYLLAWADTNKSLDCLKRELQKHSEEITLVNVPFNYKSCTSIYDNWQLRLLGNCDKQALESTTNLHLPERLSYIHNLINYAQLKNQYRQGQRPLFFDIRDNRLHDLGDLAPRWFEPIDLSIPVSSNSASVDLTGVPNLQRADFIELTVTGPGTDRQFQLVDAMVPAFAPQGKALTIYWQTNLSDLSYKQSRVFAALPGPLNCTVYRLPVSDKVNWKCAHTISCVGIYGLPQNHKLTNVRLVDQEKLVPSLTIKTGCSENVCAGKQTTLLFDASHVIGASTRIEISRVESAFCIHPITYRETSPRKGSKILSDFPARGELVLTRQNFESAGHYYVRVQAVDQEKHPCAFFSDPVELTVSDRNLESDFDHLIFDVRPEKQR